MELDVEVERQKWLVQLGQRAGSWRASVSSWFFRGLAGPNDQSPCDTPYSLLYMKTSVSLAPTCRICLGWLLLAAWLPLEALAQSVGFETTLGGAGRTTAFATRHHEGFTYVAGTTTAADFPSTDGSTHRGDDGEVGDMFLAKFNAAGQLVAATLLGGSGSDFANGMAITPGQEGGAPATITLSGWTGSADFRTLNPIQPTLGGKTDTVIAQYDVNLNLLFSTFLGGTEDDQFSGVVAMYDRDLMFFGFTTSTDFPFPSPNAAPAENTVKNLSNNTDGLLVKMLPDRSIPMASLFRRTSSGNGTQNEVILAGAFRVIPDGPFEQQALLYVTGWTDGDFFRHSSDPTGSGKRIFMSRIDTDNGARGYSRVLGGSGDDIGQGIAITTEGVVVVGQTTSADLPNPQPLFQPGHGGGTDAVLVAWTHQLLFVTRPPFTAYLGGAGDDSARALGEAKVLAGAPSPGLHFAGVTSSADLPLPATPRTPPAQASFGGGTDGFFGSLGMVFNPESSGPGVLLQARGLTYHGGPGEEAFTALAVVAEDAEGFEAAVMGARRPPPLGAAPLATAGGARLDDPIAQEIALFVNFVVGRAGLDADLAVSFKPRGGLAPGVVEKVTLVVTNLAEAPSALLNLFLEDLAPLGGGPTTELTRIEINGFVLAEVSDPLPFQLSFASLGLLGVVVPGESVELDLFIRSLPGALQANPPGAGLLARIIATPDLHPANDIATMVFPLLSSSPQIHVQLISAKQDPAGVLGAEASYEFRVENKGGAASENTTLNFKGANLKEGVYWIDDGPNTPLSGIELPAGATIPIGVLQPGQSRLVNVVCRIDSSFGGTRLSATGADPADPSTENPTAAGETIPGPGPDYAVEIIEQSASLQMRDGAPAIRVLTTARLTLTVPDEVDFDRVAPATLLIEHAAESAELTVSPEIPETLGNCVATGEFSAGCDFSPAAFLLPFVGETIPIEITIGEWFDPAAAASELLHRLDVFGDGELPGIGNNFDATRALLAPLLDIRLVGSQQDPPGYANGMARYQFRVENRGLAAAKNTMVNLKGVNLRNGTWRFDDGPSSPLPGIGNTDGVAIALGPLPAGQGRTLLVEGEPANPLGGTGLNATLGDSGEADPEKNTAGGETTPGPGPDYAVEITSRATELATVEGSPAIRLRTVARLTLTLPPGVASPDGIAAARLVIGHTRFSTEVTANPGNMGQCETLDSFSTGCSFPAAAFFQPGAVQGSIEITIDELFELASQPPVAELSLSVSGDGQDPTRPNNFASAFTPFLPRVQVRFLGAEQDPPGVSNPRARHRFRVENVGNATARRVEVAFSSATLRNATCRIDDGPAFALDRIGLPAGDLISIGAIAPGQGRNLVVEGEPVDLSSGTKLSAVASDPDDENPENNKAEGETTPAPNPDYGVEIVEQTTALEFVDGVPAIRLRTSARLTLALAPGVSADRVPPASLVIRHAGTSPVVSATPGNLGTCERLDATTTGCSFPAAAFFQPGQPPGLIRLSIAELLDIANPPTLAAVSLSVSGDGQNPEAPNNFASATREIGSKGALSFVLVFASAETVRLPGGQIVRFFTQHVRLRNEGPGAVDNIRLNIFSRYDPTIPNLPPMVQLPRVISGSAAGVSINATPSGQEVLVASLAPRAEIVLEFVDMYETMGRGGIDLEAPPGADLNVGNNPDFRFVEVFGFDQIGLRADMAISVLSQHFEVEERAGGRVPVRVTEFAVANLGENPNDNVNLGLRGFGVHLGGALMRRSGSGASSSLTPVLGVNRPEAPANPNVIQVSLGRFLPGQTNVYVLRDDVAEPGRDALLGLSGDVTSGGYDENVANNVFSRDTEYQAAQATLDYSVFLRQTSLERFPDPNLSTPVPVPAIRSRFECGFSGAQGADPLPRFILEIQQHGTILDVRLVPKTPGAPIPVTGFQVTRDHALSFSVTCDFSAAIARDFYIETVAAVVPPGQSALLAIQADLTGDGEIPSDGNNNRARGSFEYQAADLAVTRLPGGAELPGLFDGGAVTDRWLVENKSPTATARGVRLTRIETTIPPLPLGLERAVEVLSVTGDLPLDPELCLQGAAGGSCLVGDIEPGGRREVVVLSSLATLPVGVAWTPIQVTLGLHAVADNEAQLGDNTATHDRLARLVLFGAARVENGEFVIQLHFPSGGAAPVIEQAPSVNGPWTPVPPPQNSSELRLPITGQQGYLRGRMGPETP